MRLGKSKEVSVDEENPYWMSFSDIMSALLVIFILASVILILQLMEIQK
ncbi:MAG: chemotaxis protein MotB, partial [Pseudomonas aeruginosa]|nr:chemotaxis protein MotB [Pseudomonas aeruginosa]